MKQLVWIPTSTSAATPSLVSRITAISKNKKKWRVEILYPYTDPKTKEQPLIEEFMVKGTMEEALSKAAKRRQDLKYKIKIDYKKVIMISAPRRGKIDLSKKRPKK